MPTDPKHGVWLPAGRDLTKPLRLILSRMGREVRSGYKNQRKPDLDKFRITLATAMFLPLQAYYARGGNRTMKDINNQLEAKKPKKKAVVIETGKKPKRVSQFNVLLPEVIESIRNHVFLFVDETIQTSKLQVDEAYDQTALDLADGISQGEATKSLNERIGKIFDDPMRAARIAQTEASRAMHNGQMLAAQQSGIVIGFKWLASSDACERCLKLDGQVRKIGQPFYVDPKGGPYAVVKHPPLHPHCMCAMTEELE